VQAQVQEHVGQEVRHARVLVIGSGFAGLAMAIRLRSEGLTRPEDLLVLERAAEVGGTWRDNTYPGAACDVPSQLYSFSFAPNPRWSRSFSFQPEIQRYLRAVADDSGVRAQILFSHPVTGARFDEQQARWYVDTDRGAFSAQFLVTAVGALSDPRVPDLPGLADFGGDVFHSARWDHDLDLTGRRVAVMGTGASAIQFVPRIAPEVSHLTLFQRTPPWVLPRTDRALTAAEHWAYTRSPRLQRLAREGVYWARETYAYGFTRNPRLLTVAERIARAHLRHQVADPALRARLTPTYRIGCKRILISNDYYPALTRPDVDVVASGVARLEPGVVVAADGGRHEADTLIFGTGFQVTDMPMAHWLRGRGGRTLADAWAETGTRAHLGATVDGFPNLFLLVGPNTGLGHSSQVFMIEQQVAYVAAALAEADRRGAATVEVRAQAVDASDAEVQQRMARTIWATGGCDSWYLDASGRNTTLWPDFTFRYRQRLARFDAESFTFGRVTAALPVGVPA